jgi:DNA-binding transcriptional LysR family regulator
MDRIAAMNAFVRVVEAGNFTKAADTLDLPNATVTRLIQALEQHLQVRLLQRTTRTVSVTPEGASYYERVLRLLADLSDIESTAKQALAKPSGRIRVEAAAAVGTMVILPALGEFYRDYPDVTIELGIGNRRADLIAEGIDCAIRAGEATEQFMVARRIGEFRFTTCATPACIARHGAPQAPEALQALPTVGMTTASGRALPFRFCEGGTEAEIALQHVLTVNDTNAYLAAGLAGLGIIQAPDYVVQAALASGQLVSLLDGCATQGIPLNVIYPPNRFLSAKVRVFIDWLIDLFDRRAQSRLDRAGSPGSQGLQ